MHSYIFTATSFLIIAYALKGTMSSPDSNASVDESRQIDKILSAPELKNNPTLIRRLIGYFAEKLAKKGVKCPETGELGKECVEMRKTIKNIVKSEKDIENEAGKYRKYSLVAGLLQKVFRMNPKKVLLNSDIIISGTNIIENTENVEKKREHLLNLLKNGKRLSIGQLWAKIRKMGKTEAREMAVKASILVLAIFQQYDNSDSASARMVEQYSNPRIIATSRRRRKKSSNGGAHLPAIGWAPFMYTSEYLFGKIKAWSEQSPAFRYTLRWPSAFLAFWLCVLLALAGFTIMLASWIIGVPIFLTWIVLFVISLFVDFFFDSDSMAKALVDSDFLGLENLVEFFIFLE